MTNDADRTREVVQRAIDTLCNEQWFGVPTFDAMTSMLEAHAADYLRAKAGDEDVPESVIQTAYNSYRQHFYLMPDSRMRVVDKQAWLDAIWAIRPLLAALDQRTVPDAENGACPDALRAYALWVLEHCWKGADIDGGSAQDKADELGLLVKSQRNGADWFELKPLTTAAIPASATVAGDACQTKEVKMDQIQSWADENLPYPKDINEAVRQRNAWCDSAAQFSRNEDYYRDLLDQIGEALGDEALIADDGSRPGGILRAKLPDLVRARLATFASVREPRAVDGVHEESTREAMKAAWDRVTAFARSGGKNAKDWLEMRDWFFAALSSNSPLMPEQPAPQPVTRGVTEEVRPLVEASVRMYLPDPDTDDENDDVAFPACGITFGMVRRARDALLSAAMMGYVYILSTYEEHGARDVHATLNRDDVCRHVASHACQSQRRTSSTSMDPG